MICTSIQEDPELNSDLSHTWSWDRELAHTEVLPSSSPLLLLYKACNKKIRFYLSSKSAKSLPEIQYISVHEVLQLKQKGIFRMNPWIKPATYTYWCLHADTQTHPFSDPFNINIYISHTHSWYIFTSKHTKCIYSITGKLRLLIGTC